MAYLSPIGNEQQNDANGAPLSGGKIYTYAAGTSTPATTYTGEDEGTAQSNPIVLNASGLPASPIWLHGGVSYKFVITDAEDNTLRTIDNITGINDPAVASTTDQWVIYTGSPTYISATSFSVGGDQTNVFQVGRRLRSVNTGGTVYSTITAASFGSSITTVTVRNDSGALDSGLSQVSYGLLSVSNPSIPRAAVDAGAPAFSAYNAGSQGIGSAVQTKCVFNAERFDTANCFDTTSYRFTPTVPGYYQIDAGVLMNPAASNVCTLTLYKNGSVYAELGRFSSATGMATGGCLVYMNGTTDYVELYALTLAASATLGSSDPRYMWFSGVLARSA